MFIETTCIDCNSVADQLHYDVHPGIRSLNKTDPAPAADTTRKSFKFFLFILFLSTNIMLKTLIFSGYYRIRRNETDPSESGSATLVV